MILERFVLCERRNNQRQKVGREIKGHKKPKQPGDIFGVLEAITSCISKS